MYAQACAGESGPPASLRRVISVLPLTYSRTMKPSLRSPLPLRVTKSWMPTMFGCFTAARYSRSCAATSSIFGSFESSSPLRITQRPSTVSSAR